MGDVLLTLTQLAYVSAVVAAGLEVLFETKLYQAYLGKGLNGDGSKFFTSFELRPWIAIAVGICVAWQFDLCAIIEGLNISLPEFAALSGTDSVDRINAIDRVLTGIVIGGGAKSIKALAKSFASTRKEAKETLSV